MSQCRKFFAVNNILVVPVLAVALSALLVGLVWASSSALERQQGLIASIGTDPPQYEEFASRSSTSLFEMPSDGNTDDRFQNLTERLDMAEQNIEILSAQIYEAQNTIETSDMRITQLITEVSALKINVELMRDQLAALNNTVGGVDTRLVELADVIARKTSGLNDEGKYIGLIAPSQIAPQLRVVDIAGSWPMNRTTGDLDLSRMNSDLSWCSADSRNYSVLSVDAFRRLACTRIPK